MCRTTSRHPTIASRSCVSGWRIQVGHNTVARPQAVWAGSVVQTDVGLSRAYGNSGKVFVLCVRPDSSWETIEIAL